MNLEANLIPSIFNRLSCAGLNGRGSGAEVYPKVIRWRWGAQLAQEKECNWADKENKRIWERQTLGRAKTKKGKCMIQWRSVRFSYGNVSGIQVKHQSLSVTIYYRRVTFHLWGSVTKSCLGSDSCRKKRFHRGSKLARWKNDSPGRSVHVRAILTHYAVIWKVMVLKPAWRTQVCKGTESTKHHMLSETMQGVWGWGAGVRGYELWLTLIGWL